jgi:6-phosphogluconolactonase (cycloisomerase 2 family)
MGNGLHKNGNIDAAKVKARNARQAFLLAALLLPLGFVAGCKDFWAAPSSTSFALTNSGNISVSPGNSGTSTITVTPSDSFTGTVALTCAVTAPSGATSAATCSLSSSSVTISDTSAVTSTLTVATTSSTTTGTYDITVTGTSDSVSETTTLCAAVSTSSTTCTASSGSSSGVFYVLNQETKQIVGYSISSGSLSKIASYSLSYVPYSIAIAPSGNFLYVGTAAGIYMYKVGSSGTLTLGNSSTVISSDVASTMQVDSTGKWLVEASSDQAYLFAIPISVSTGLPTSSTEQETALPSSSVQQLCISPDNNYVFVADGTSGTERVVFTSGSSSPFGTKSNIATYNTIGAALSVAVDPESRLLYIGETVATSGTNTGGLRVLTYSTMNEVSGSPFATGGLAPYSILPLQNGTYADEYVYVANRTVSGSSYGNVYGYEVTTSGSTYTVSALNSTATAGIYPVSLAQDSMGNYVMIVSYGGSPDLKIYSFDSSTAGVLDTAVSSATGTDPVGAIAIAAAP